jgi:organic radical activating enzyme
MLDSYYCSQKFTSLSVDLEKRLIYSCCAAVPEKIDLNWLRENPGRLFASAKLQQERQAMLDNTPVDSCNKACWIPESQGLQSRREQYQTYKLTHTDTQVFEPEHLNIILGSTCNLTCSYCCKQYSTAWYRDIAQNGVYFDDARFNLTALDKILSQVSQDEHERSEGFDLIVKELTNYKNLKEIVIDGGEPFLYNRFPELLNSLDNSASIVFYTGLGVNTKRLLTQLKNIKHPEKVTAAVSAECCDSLYEFNRYNNSYQNFLENLKILQTFTTVKFSSVISNLTIHGLVNFVDQFPNTDKTYNICNDPDYLSINVLDDQTKLSLSKSILNSNVENADRIVSSMMKPCSEQQRQQLATYLDQFARRRNLKLDIFPSSMLQWLNLTGR